MASQRSVNVGGVQIGGGAPVAVQTMTKTETANLGIEGRSLAELAAEEQIVAAVQAAVDKGNAELARVEQIKKFTIIPGDWAPGGDELTPTLKLKRKPIHQKYEADIEAMYGAS